MRIEMIDTLGYKCSVDESKLDKCLAAGYKPAAEPVKEVAEEVKEAPKSAKAKKPTVRKAKTKE